MLKEDKYTKLFNNLAKNSKICIYGSNKTAEQLFDKLKELRSDIDVKFFIDSKNSGELKGLPVYLAQDLDAHLNEFDTVLVASYAHRFYMEFILKAFGIKNIVLITKDFLPKEDTKKNKWNVEKSAKIFKTLSERNLYRFLAKARDNKKKYEPEIEKYYNKKYPNRIDLYPFEHYFEFINKDAIKTAIDGGACNGIHSLITLQTLPKCKKVYAFEPCYNSFKNNLFDKLIQRHPEIEIIQKALWKEDTRLSFREEFSFKAASAVVEKKPDIKRPAQIITVDAVSIDSFVEQNHIEKIDFIKMDLENAEQEALEGAKNTLLKHRPQLAISIYHSAAQFYEIPVYLKELLPDYEFRLGHYRETICETVLYAIPKELVK